MTIRRALSVTTAVAATAPIAPPRAILPGLFQTSLSCACCVAVESCQRPPQSGEPTQGRTRFVHFRRTSCRDWSPSSTIESAQAYRAWPAKSPTGGWPVDPIVTFLDPSPHSSQNAAFDPPASAAKFRWGEGSPFLTDWR